MEDEKLIELVRNHSELYDTRHKKYSDSTHKRKLWKEIGLVLQQDAKKCKMRWESLRSQFRKFLRNKQEATGQVPNLARWRYGDLLEFILPYMKEAKLRVGDDMWGSPQQEDEDSMQSSGVGVSVKQEDDGSDDVLDVRTILETAPSTWKHVLPRRKEPTASSFTETEHKPKEQGEIDLFFDMMKATAKKFTEAEWLCAKQKVFQVITEIETNRLNNQQSCYYTNVDKYT